MGEKLSRLLSILTKSRYTRHLEQENEQLRTELERWQNALLTQQGLPPITPRESKPFPITRPRYLPSQWKSRVEKATHKPEAKTDA